MGSLLEGIRAIELAAFGNGPIIGIILADMGAEVIKIEDRIGGDPSRGLASLHGVDTISSGGVNLVFESSNRGKKSLTLDLKKEKGREIAYRLMEKADVFYSNYRRPALKRIHMDYETLVKYNPGLIYATASGYGKEGPDMDKRAFDPIGLARSGIMMAAGERNGPPGEIVGAVADTLGATMTAFGIVGGLLERERHGIGQEIDASLLGSMLWLQYTSLALALTRGRAMARHLRTKARNPLANAYQCKDDKWIKLGEPQSDRFWQPFCRMVGMDSLGEDPRYSDAKKRWDNCEELIHILDDVFRKKTRDEWITFFRAANFEMAYEGIYDLMEATEDEQVWANRYIVKDQHPVLGEIKLAQFPVNFSATGLLEHKQPAPEFGQHTEEILLDLGYDWDFITRMKEEEVI